MRAFMSVKKRMVAHGVYLLSTPSSYGYARVCARCGMEPISVLAWIYIYICVCVCMHWGSEFSQLMVIRGGGSLGSQRV